MSKQEFLRRSSSAPVEILAGRRESGNSSKSDANPRFSVLISTYNRPEYVRQTIESVLSQTFTDYEVIVVDDGSTDETRQVLESFGSRIRFRRQSNAGPESARDEAAA